MNQFFHPLTTSVRLPRQFTYPFCYEPHPLCRAAAAEVQRHIEASGVWAGEKGCGKMFGVLVVEQNGMLGFLAAYSGLLAGRNDWPYFVPPVFDAQQPDGHFKQTERAISAINGEIDAMEHSYRYMAALAAYNEAKRQSDTLIAAARRNMDEAKAQRDMRRHEAAIGTRLLTASEQADMTRESQHMKAELRRTRQRQETILAELRQPIDDCVRHTAELRRRRREMSDTLQQWLFRQYVVLNARGERRNLIDIFSDTTHGVPPAGAGDCCAPKLLQYAYANAMRPVCMAEFWWGESPRNEIRHHLHYYPACRSKCLPILTHMLQGLDVEPNPLAAPVAAKLNIIYEDDALAVVEKPQGMLSVPGKDALPSVESIMRTRWHTPPGQPVTVHRLDRDTSGLMVVARTHAAYADLQQQFAARLIQKRYEAVLDGCPPCPDSGTISLPLRPDPTDRPRQCADAEHGKEAITEYRIVRRTAHRTLVYLWPHTGRTHQLRVHCAHQEGLNTPILGDPLYGRGTPSPRMLLHAAEVEFAHPLTGRRMHFSSDSHFGDMLD